MVSHHVYLEFPNEGIGAGSVTIKEEWGNTHRFQISCRLYGNKMSRGYCSWVVWSSEGVVGSPRSSWSSWAVWTSWCSSESDVEGVSDMAWVLMLCVSRRVLVVSRYKGSRDDFCSRCQGLCRHNMATVCNMSNRGSLLGIPFSVWASWATCFDNCWCAPDLYANREC